MQALPELADYAVWAPIENGMRLYAYWEGACILVLTVLGLPAEQSLPWANDIVRSSVAASRTAPGTSRVSAILPGARHATAALPSAPDARMLEDDTCEASER